MAIIATHTERAEVQAIGKAHNATVNFSGALMEMLATIYKYIMMAAVREAIQNSCDAARRNGKSFAEGVRVTLPTPSNPMFTVEDDGAGMTKEFMEDPAEGYLSFGSSTKRNDDGSVGGLGVGRWAAYGYVRECYISTCHASDGIRRTYFQFQGDDAKPQVQLASEVPDTKFGTKVFFPVKEADIPEALRAVSWLKAVMQLTMGDSFSVDSPAALPEMLPAPSGAVLDLGTEDPSLKGIKVYPMAGSDLHYDRQGCSTGSLIVLTNKEAGVGGLPFHVGVSSDDSVFTKGMVIEIPMSYRIPFMPSREEIKYSDEVSSLMLAIDRAAGKAVINLARSLFDKNSLKAKDMLSRLLGEAGTHHYFAKAARAETPISGELRKAIGGRNWTGDLFVPSVPGLRDGDMAIRYFGAAGALQPVFGLAGNLSVSGGKERSVEILFKTKAPVTLVVNDVPTGGQTRFRHWLDPRAKYLLISHKKDVAKAHAAAADLNERFGGELEVILVSSMPEYKREVLGGKVVRTKLAVSRGLTYYCFTKDKQEVAEITLTEPIPEGARRVWVGKDGAKVAGFLDGQQLGDFAGGSWQPGLKEVLALPKVRQLFLLTPKQQRELAELESTLKKDGYWDMSADELLDEEDGEELAATVAAVRAWVPLETVLKEVVDRPDVQAIVENRVMQKVTESAHLNYLVTALARKPRMELTGTKVDRLMAPYVDVLSGTSKLHTAAKVNAVLHQACQGMRKVGAAMDITTADHPDRRALGSALARMHEVGIVDYNTHMAELVKALPFLSVLKVQTYSAEQADDLVKALAVLYR